MPAITPNFLFATQALEAAEFYVSIFPNATLDSVSYYGPGAPLPEGTPLVAEFTLDGTAFQAINGGQAIEFTSSVSFRIVCHGQDEVDHYWNALGAGGAEGRCGWLTDKFGVSWQVTPVEMGEYLGHADPEVSQRCFMAMMGMKKIDLAEFEAIARLRPITSRLSL